MKVGGAILETVNSMVLTLRLLTGKSIPSLAVENFSLEFQHILKTKRPIQPPGLREMSEEEIAQRWDHTQISIQNFSYKWTISNFHFILREIEGHIRSPTFSIGANDKWYLRVYLKGVDEGSSDYLSVYLVLLSCLKSHIWAKFQFWIVDAKGKKIQGVGTHRVFRFMPGYDWGFKNLIPREFLLSHASWIIPDNRLTLLCKVSMVQGYFNISNQNRKPGIQIPRCTLTGELGELWQNSRFTDCCLVVAGQEFQAHNAILEACSPVYRAMFEHVTEESKKNLTEFHDLEPQVFKTMMDFIYTGKPPNLDSRVDALLAAADKYGMKCQKVMCEDALCMDLTVENASHTLFLDDLHRAEHLKRQTRLHYSHVSEVSRDL
ncbi:hypothetical protein STEG23_034371 [Scotinomys teguina]